MNVPPAELAARPAASFDLTASHHGLGRELFAGFRQVAGSAEDGALSIPGLCEPAERTIQTENVP